MLEEYGQNNIEFKELQANEYYFLGREMKTALSDHYVGQAAGSKGYDLMGFSSTNSCGFGLYMDNSLISYAVTLPENGTLNIVYIFTKLSERGRGFATMLLGKVCTFCKGRMRIHITDTFPTYKAIVSMAIKTGFVKSESSTVYSLDVNEDLWKLIASKGIDRIQRPVSADKKNMGERCIAFNELSEDELDQIKNSCVNEFDNALPSPANFISNPAMKLDRNFSFAFFKGERLLAYTLISRPKPDYAVIEQIATAREYIGKGLVLYPLCATIRSGKEQDVVKKVSMAIMDNNEASKKLVFNIIEGLTINKIKNENYYR